VIPVVGIPHLSNDDLLVKCIESFPEGSYGKIHVIDNGPGLDAGILAAFPNVYVTRTHHNMGVGAAWNLIMKLNPFERWWCIINNDVAFIAEDLARLERAMRVHDVVTFQGMHAFGMRASAIASVGWFDENFVPCYFEDNDWDRRASLLGTMVHQIEPQAYHFGSAAIKREDRYRRENNRTFPGNQAYYVAKWGGSVGAETYTTPFNRGGSPRDWTLDMNRLANQSWKE